MSQAAAKIQTATPMLSVNNIEVVYDEVIQVLRGVTLEVPEGEVVTLLGPNGAGKTTTLRMLSTALKPDSGSVSINGTNVLSNPVIARKKIGFLSGSTGLYGRLSGRENIEYFAKLHGMSQLSLIHI